jgi:hypothetical protein
MKGVGVLLGEQVVLWGELKDSSTIHLRWKVMKKHVIGAIAILFVFSVAVCYAPVSKAAGGMSSPISTLSPTSQTYNSTSPIVLKTEIVGLGGSNVHYSMTYCLDGQDNITLPFTNQNQEWPLQITMIGKITLPQLAEGTHNITAYQKLEIDYNSSPPKTDILWDSASVNFTVNDQKPPTLQSLSIENQTYSQNSLQLNLTLDEPTSWVAYSLDNQKNVTINGNTTLVNLSTGSHSLQVFANDTVGNIATTNTNFTIAQPVSNFYQASITIAITGCTLAAIASLIYFKRRNSNTA